MKLQHSMMIFRNHASSFAPLGFAAFGCRRHFGFGCARWTDPETLCRLSAAKGLQKGGSDEHWRILASSLVRPLADTDLVPFALSCRVDGRCHEDQSYQGVLSSVSGRRIRTLEALKRCGKKSCLKSWRACCQE